ncbi:small subunit of carbamoyl-phosphate synthase [Neoconidiobolus thromboides FSU 785]|nr:small subunit of carbamoyl-phosphate synthase [Neoconidiobolus thromboides FSU 785]
MLTKFVLAHLKSNRSLFRSFATVKEGYYSSPEVIDSTQVQYLKLKSGQLFKGLSFGAEKECSGEAVFTTSTVGYPESMTDPSFRGQILVFTQPLIGNYGAPNTTRDEFNLLKYYESEKIQVEGIIVNDYATQYSHWNAIESLGAWCKRNNVPAISNVDTRMVVKLLRDQGSTLASMQFDKEKESEYKDPNLRNLVDEVSTKKVYTVGKGKINIAVIDCGIKNNILRSLLGQSEDIKLTVLPWNYDIINNKIEGKSIHDFDGLFLSNGPGNPNYCQELISNMSYLVENFNKPIFGICMGNQVLGKSIGLDVYKMKFGNRGHNQPAINLLTNRCFITSQNHGYALNDTVLPNNWLKYFTNANDHSNEGIKHQFKPISSVQFHPEAKGGPMDTHFLFKDYIELVKQYKLKDLHYYDVENEKVTAYA